MHCNELIVNKLLNFLEKSYRYIFQKTTFAKTGR